MFINQNAQPNFEELAAFIEKPTYNCNSEELKTGVMQVLWVLAKNPAGLMHIIKKMTEQDSFLPATFALDMLCEKMEKENCMEKLGILFDKCADELIESCVYNRFDLARCIANLMPNDDDKINQLITKIIENEKWIQRILEGENNPADTLKNLNDTYPKYKEQFTAFYAKHFNYTPTL